MTDDKIALRTLLEKGSDATFLREMIGFAAQRLMELESEALCGAGHGERSAERRNQRDGVKQHRVRTPPKPAANNLISLRNLDPRWGPDRRRSGPPRNASSAKQNKGLRSMEGGGPPRC